MPRRNRKQLASDRRHTNTDGRRQIKRGKCARQVMAIARRLGIPYVQRTKTNILKRSR